jgi:hypothetical protein
MACCTRASARCALLCSHARTAAYCYTVQRNAARDVALLGATQRSTRTFVEYFEIRRKHIFRLKVKNIFEFDGRGRGGAGASAGAVRTRAGHRFPESAKKAAWEGRVVRVP